MTVHRSNDLESNSQPGSPQPGEPFYLMVGKLRRPHGVKGELSFELTTEYPESIKPGTKVFIGKKKIAAKLAQIRAANNYWLVCFEGYDDYQAVENFRNQWVYIQSQDAAPLPEGRFYHHEVIGMQVFSETQDLMGEISEILVTGANDVYVVKHQSGSEILIPAIKSVVVEIDRNTRRMIVRQQEWL